MEVSRPSFSVVERATEQTPLLLGRLDTSEAIQTLKNPKQAALAEVENAAARIAAAASVYSPDIEQAIQRAEAQEVGVGKLTLLELALLVKAVLPITWYVSDNYD